MKFFMIIFFEYYFFRKSLFVNVTTNHKNLKQKQNGRRNLIFKNCLIRLILFENVKTRHKP